MNDTESIIACERRMAAAHVCMDLHEIDTLLHDDYALLQPGGAIESKREVLASYGQGTRTWSRAEVDQLDVSIHGDCARVIGRWRAAGVNNGSAFDYQARFVSIWVKLENTWRNLAYASAELDA